MNKKHNYKSYSNLSLDKLHKINLLSIKNQSQLNEYITQDRGYPN